MNYVNVIIAQLNKIREIADEDLYTSVYRDGRFEFDIYPAVSDTLKTNCDAIEFYVKDWIYGEDLSRH